MAKKFPSSFLWGAAISSYQTEGGNSNSDWAVFEADRGLETANRACDHYFRFEKDFLLAKKLDLNSLRISIEWARVLPSFNKFDEREIAHYLKVVDSLSELGLEPFITLHHFTNPIWFSQNGGWLKSRNIDCFLKFVSRIANDLKSKVRYWMIFNEPMVYLFKGYLEGAWPPGEKSLTKSLRVVKNMLSAYKTAYQEIKNVYNQQQSYVSITKHMLYFQGCERGHLWLNRFSAFLRDKLFNDSILDYLASKKIIDFIGLNYYRKEYSEFVPLLGRECGHQNHCQRRNSLNWYVYPEGLGFFLDRLKKYGLPIFITENGTAENEEEYYQPFLMDHLKEVKNAIDRGVDVRGYFYWSLLDNFEWDKGFNQRFGLYSVNYDTLERNPRQFSSVYGKIAKDNMLPDGDC